MPFGGRDTLEVKIEYPNPFHEYKIDVGKLNEWFITLRHISMKEPLVMHIKSNL